MAKKKQRKKDRAPEPDTLFGELRAVLQKPEVTEGQRIHLWGMCVRMFKHHPKMFMAQWRPYLESYASHWRPDLLDLTSKAEFTRATKMLPDVRFPLTIYKSKYDWPNQQRIDTRDLMTGEHLRSVSKLTLHHHLSMLRQQHLGELEELEIIAHERSVADALIAASESPCRDRLRTLKVLAIRERTQPGLDRLAHITPFARLGKLDLRRCALTSYGIEKIASAGVLDHLTHLDLSDTHLHEVALTHLMRREILEHLTHLALDDLRDTTRDACTLSELLASTSLTKLTHLSLVAAFYSSDSAQSVMQAIITRHEHLEVLDLSRNRVLGECLMMLADSDLFALRTLRLHDCTMNVETIELLSQHPYFSRLDELGISAYRLSQEHTDMLAESRTLKPHVAAQFIRE